MYSTGTMFLENQTELRINSEGIVLFRVFLAEHKNFSNESTEVNTRRRSAVKKHILRQTLNCSGSNFSQK